MSALNKQKNIPLLISVTAAVTILLAAYLLMHGFNAARQRSSIQKASYLAEAGLSRAIWYLNTPVVQGGKGISWRTEGIVEKFDPGTYTITVKNGDVSEEVIITSIGSFGAYSRADSQVLIRNKFPAAFDYSLFSASSFKMEGNCEIYGDVYCRGSISADFPSRITEGFAYTFPGYVVSGSGDYKVGAASISLIFPRFEGEFYSERITEARAGKARIKGDKSYSSLDLSEDLFIDGNVNVSGQISGAGSIISSKSIKISNSMIQGTHNFIAGENIEVDNTTSTDKNNIFYATKNMTIKGSSAVKGSLIVKAGKFLADGNVFIYGPVYSAGENTKLKGKTTVYGAVVANRIETITDSVVIHHDQSYFPDMPPHGMADEVLGKK